MSEVTLIDSAFAAMEAAPDKDALRLAFYERLGDGELFLLLEAEAKGDQITAQTFDIGAGEIVLVFDRHERLTAFTGAPSPYAALSGRVIAQMLTGKNLGLGLNLEVASSSFLLDAKGVDWWAQVLSHVPDEVEAKIDQFIPPKGLPEVLMTAIDTKLAAMTGLAISAYLVGLSYKNGGTGHLLGFVGALPVAKTALTQAMNEALIFSGIEAGVIDIGFFNTDDPVTSSLTRVGLRFDLPQIQKNDPIHILAPGSDPEKPPIL